MRHSPEWRGYYSYSVRTLQKHPRQVPLTHVRNRTETQPKACNIMLPPCRLAPLTQRLQPPPSLQSSCAAACTRNHNTVCCSSHTHTYHKHLERASSLQPTTSLSYPSLIRHPSATSFSARPSWTIGASACAALHPPPSPLPPSKSPSRAVRPSKRNAPVPVLAP